MGLSPILKFRIQRQNCRRRQQWGAEPERLFAVALIGPTLLVAGLFARHVAFFLNLHNLPRAIVFAGVFAASFALAFLMQLRFRADVGWNRFLATMPVSTWDRFIVRAYDNLSAALIGWLLTCSAATAIGNGFYGIATVVLFSTLLIALAWGLAIIAIGTGSQPVWENTAWGTIRISKRLRAMIDHRGGTRAAQILIESLRMLRGRKSRLLSCFLVSSILLLSIGGLPRIIASIVLVGFAMCAIGERSNLLLTRRGDRGYDVYAVDAADYLYGVIIASGWIVLLACAVQLPLLSAHGIDRAQLIRISFACCGIAFASLARLLAFDSLDKTGKAWRNWNDALSAGVVGAMFIKEVGMAIFLFVLRIGVVRIPPLVIGTIMMMLALKVGGWAPILLAALVVAIEASLVKRSQVVEKYWGRR